MKFHLKGEISHLGSIVVEADDLDELRAILNRQHGTITDNDLEFAGIFDEVNDCIIFTFDDCVLETIKDENGNIIDRNISICTEDFKPLSAEDFAKVWQRKG
jgi:hypothetical protein